jgi:uncharacterized protein (TIGR03435 family)
MMLFATSLGGDARNDLGRKVVDQTGLTGYYTIALHWTPVETTNPSTTGLSAPEASGPSVFTAVKRATDLVHYSNQSPWGANLSICLARI